MVSPLQGHGARGPGRVVYMDDGGLTRELCEERQDEFQVS
jgi:hypothetical protein